MFEKKENMSSRMDMQTLLTGIQISPYLVQTIVLGRKERQQEIRSKTINGNITKLVFYYVLNQGRWILVTQVWKQRWQS